MKHKLLFDFICPQLAMLVDCPPKEKGWIHEIKFDGHRLQVHFKKNKVKIFSRNGHELSHKFPELIMSFKKLPIKSAIFDGEAVVLDKNGISSFVKLQEALSQHRSDFIKIF
ncbi:MAG: hypothetical protein Q7U04_03080, partial [Bacteriovorax sp.]|nr:hypothetical protein [Bacteriovorax sp.]